MKITKTFSFLNGVSRVAAWPVTLCKMHWISTAFQNRSCVWQKKKQKKQKQKTKKEQTNCSRFDNMTRSKFSAYIHYRSITLAPYPICLIMLALKFLLRFQNDLDCEGSLRKRWNYRWHGSKTFLQQTLLDTTALLDATSNDLLGGRYFWKNQLHPMH